jgi:hypothetical protein
MSSQDDRHALQRFVAGLDVEPDALATALAAEAIDHLVVEEALLRALAADEATARVRAARRVARMPEVSQRVLAQLRVIADADQDPRAREQAAAALTAHEGPRAVAPLARRRGGLAILRWELLGVRGGQAYAYAPKVRADLDTGAILAIADGVPRLELSGLPERCRGRWPMLLVEGDEVGVAEAAVSPDGEAAIVFPAWTGSLGELSELIEGAELAIANG